MIRNESSIDVAIVHYHMKPGGVTRVIENAVLALADYPVNIVVLTGEAYHGDVLRPLSGQANLKGIIPVPGLQYTRANEKIDPGALAYTLGTVVRNILGRSPDVWHFHNHSLGKNTAMPGCAARMGADTAGVLYQIHDFAEDGRPSNWQKICGSLANPRYLYPTGNHIHYAALNGRDLAILKDAGLNTHFLPNPVAGCQNALPIDSDRGQDLRKRLGSPNRLITYPTRAIRRKNIGEFLYWATCAADGDLYATTLSPDNPQWQDIYEAWVQFALKEKLPASFALGEGHNAPAFDETVAASDAMLTTSVAEGFGLAFLEPWTQGKALVGRDLPDITADFKDVGVSLDHLYQRLEVPLDWVGEETLRNKIRDRLIGYYQAYGQALPNDAVEIAWTSMVQNGQVDFGRLDEPLQRKALSRLAQTPTEPIQTAPVQDCIAHNKQAIAEHFSIRSYGERLYGIYEQIASAERTGNDSIEHDAILKRFMNPARFSLLLS